MDSTSKVWLSQGIVVNMVAIVTLLTDGTQYCTTEVPIQPRLENFIYKFANHPPSNCFILVGGSCNRHNIIQTSLMSQLPTCCTLEWPHNLYMNKICCS